MRIAGVRRGMVAEVEGLAEGALKDMRRAPPDLCATSARGR